MTQSTHPDIGKRVLVECTVEGINEYHTGILSGVSDEWYEVVTKEGVAHKFMPKYWKYTVIEEKNMRKIGEIIEFEDMREGDVVEFVGYTTDYPNPNLSYWRYNVGKSYSVVIDADGDRGPLDEDGDIPPKNYGFEFKLVATQEQQNKPPKLQDGMVVEVQEGAGYGKRYIVLGETLINSSGYNNQCAYDEDLLMYGDIDNEFTIMKVYKPIKIKNLKSLFNMDDSIFARNEMELLWERKAIPTEQGQHISELEEQIEEMKQEVSAMEQKVAELKGSL